MNKTAVRRLPSFATSSKKCMIKRISLDLTSDEAKKLADYCYYTGRKTTDVIRSLVRELPVA